MNSLSISVTSGNKLYKFKVNNVLPNTNLEYCIDIVLPDLDVTLPVPNTENEVENKYNESRSGITQDTSCFTQETDTQTKSSMQEEDRNDSTPQLASGTRSPDYERKGSSGNDIPALSDDNVSGDVGNNVDRMDKEMVDVQDKIASTVNSNVNSKVDILANRVADDALDALDLIEYKFGLPQTNSLPQIEQKYPVPKNINSLTSLLKNMQPNQLSQPMQSDQLLDDVSPPIINNVHDYIKSIAHTAGDPSRKLRQIPEHIIPIDHSSSYFDERKKLYLELFTDMDSWLLNRMNSPDRRIVRNAFILDKNFSRLLLKFVRFIDKDFYSQIRYMFQGNLTIFERRLRGILLGETGCLYTLVFNALYVPGCKCDYCTA